MERMKQAGSGKSGARPTGRRILVVDDDQDVLVLIRIVLENEGDDVWCAESGEMALEQLANREFDVMLTDLNMPGMDGFELSRRARLIRPRMTILMGTGEPFADIHLRAAKAGIAKVFAKPFNYQELFTALHGKETEESPNGDPPDTDAKEPPSCSHDRLRRNPA